MHNILVILFFAVFHSILLWKSNHDLQNVCNTNHDILLVSDEIFQVDATYLSDEFSDYLIKSEVSEKNAFLHLFSQEIITQNLFYKPNYKHLILSLTDLPPPIKF